MDFTLINFMNGVVFVYFFTAEWQTICSPSQTRFEYLNIAKDAACDFFDCKINLASQVDILKGGIPADGYYNSKLLLLGSGGQQWIFSQALVLFLSNMYFLDKLKTLLVDIEKLKQIIQGIDKSRQAKAPQENVNKKPWQ